MTFYNIVFPLTFLFLLISSHNIAFADDITPIPIDKSQVESWFKTNVGSLASRSGKIDPVLVAAEANPKIVKVRKDGSGDYKTVTEAIENVPNGNSVRMIIDIGPGNYSEKIKIERTKRFVTLYGNPNNPPVLTFAGTAAVYGTVDSATVIAEADYFSAVNIVFVNSAPRPDGVRKGAQALAFRISGEKSSIYNSKFHGFQDTVCDDLGKHFFKDCYIEGTVDFIFGNGKSLYLNSELHVIPGDNMAMITAQAKHNGQENAGYSFVHCKVTGTGGIAYLGRAWMPYSTVIFSYTDMSDAVHPQGWSNNFKSENDKTVYFAEYNCTGPGSSLDKRASFTKKLSSADAKPYLSLGYIEASSWLLPPPHVAN